MASMDVDAAELRQPRMDVDEAPIEGDTSSGSSEGDTSSGSSEEDDLKPCSGKIGAAQRRFSRMSIKGKGIRNQSVKKTKKVKPQNSLWSDKDVFEMIRVLKKMKRFNSSKKNKWRAVAAQLKQKG